MIIPKDVRKHTLKYVAKVILLCVISLAVSIFVCYCLNRVQFIGNYRYILYFVIIALPVTLIVIVKILMQRSWQGKIIHLEFENIVESEQPFSPVKESLYNRYTMYGYIELKNRDVKVVKLFSGRMKDSEHFDDYEIGDEVIHIMGIKYYQVISENNNSILCGVCGAKNEKANDVCKNCGSHFVRNKSDSAE